jgi:hypothetical protein
MPIKITILLFFLSGVIFCQEKIYYIDSIKITGSNKDFVAHTQRLKMYIDSINSTIMILPDSGGFDLKHKKIGYWIEYSLDSAYSRKVKNEGNYASNHKTGVWNEYKTNPSDSGNQWSLKNLTDYINGKKNGRQIAFLYGTLDTLRIVKYRNDKIMEIKEFYYNPNGYLITKRNFWGTWLLLNYDEKGKLISKQK